MKRRGNDGLSLYRRVVPASKGGVRGKRTEPVAGLPKRGIKKETGGCRLLQRSKAGVV